MLAAVLAACAAAAGACPSLGAAERPALDAPPTVETEFSLFRLSFLDIWTDDVHQAASTHRIYEFLAAICSPGEARLLFTLRTGDVPPTRIHMFISAPKGKMADDFERAVATAPIVPQSGVKIDRADRDSLDVQLKFRDRRGRVEVLAIKLHAWELSDPRRTEAFQAPFRKARDLIGYLCESRGVRLGALEPSEIREFRVRVRCPEDGRYYELRRSRAAERRAREEREDGPTAKRRQTPAARATGQAAADPLRP